MNGFRLGLICLGFGVANLAVAQVPTPPVDIQKPSGSTSLQVLPPLPPSTPSPVALFRHVLDMSAKDRESYLTNRPAAARPALSAKINEYLAMNPDDRELRLRATELRWQLMPLLRQAPADRAARLAQVPEDLAPLVNSRLEEWDKLPAPLQAEFLENDRTLHYFAHVDTKNQVAADTGTEAEHQKIASQFNQFFDLTPEERQKTLKTLSATERAQMEATLQAFGKLPGQQRLQCLRAFSKFAELKPAERTEFLKNAERWSQMSPKERQSWRDLVSRVPTWPPVPQNLLLPPLPPRPSVKNHAAMVTNRN